MRQRIPRVHEYRGCTTTHAKLWKAETIANRPRGWTPAQLEKDIYDGKPKGYNKNEDYRVPPLGMPTLPNQATLAHPGAGRVNEKQVTQTRGFFGTITS